MNDGGMKQGQRFIALRRIEYVWLSAVWWKQPGLSDGHMERNLLNDSIPPEMSQEEGFYLCLSHSGLLSDIGRCVLEYEWKGCDKKCRLRNIGLLLHIWHACLMFKITKERQPFSFQLWWVILAFRFQLWVTAFTPILLSQRFLTRGDKTQWLPTSRQSWIKLTLSLSTLISLWKGATVIVRVKCRSLSSVIQ